MKQSDKKGFRNKIGALGESIALRYLINKSFFILDQNYLKKWGEIDIVARGTKGVHFIEVKTVSYETKFDLMRAVTHGTWRPEENVHYKKIARLNRTIESWTSENDYFGDWQLDILSVRVVTREKYATVKLIDNVIV